MLHPRYIGLVVVIVLGVLAVLAALLAAALLYAILSMPPWFR